MLFISLINSFTDDPLLIIYESADIIILIKRKRKANVLLYF